MDIRLSRGFTFIAWPGDGGPIAGALGPLASAVSAVYAWDAAAQGWLSWFPGGDDLGVNTLTAFEPGGVYVISASSARDWRVEVSGAWRAPSVVRLVRGFTFTAWRGDGAAAIGQALGSGAAVSAVYAWDAAAQGWLSWFPGGDELGVNTLTTFQPDGVYVISASSARDWRVSDDATVAGDDDGGELPTC